MRISRVTPAIARLHTSLWASQASARGPRGLGRGCLPSPPPSCGPQQSSQLLRPQPQILLPHSASAGGSDPLLQCTVGSDSGVCRCVKILNYCCPWLPHYRAGATPGFLWCWPRSCARSFRVAPGWPPAPTLTQRCNAGNPRSLRRWVIIRHASVLPHTVCRASLQGNTSVLVW